MNRNLVFVVLSALLVPFSRASSELELPTFFGLISKEVRYTMQGSGASQKSLIGATDIDGAESRLGAKGSYDTEVGEFFYLMELGINSSVDDKLSNNSIAERIRIRLSYLDWRGKYGALLLGKNWLSDTKFTFSFDPFLGTGAQFIGLEANDVVGFLPGRLGYKSRYFTDQMRYETPSLWGLRYSVALDFDNHTTLDKGVGASRWLTQSLTFQNKEGPIRWSPILTHASQIALEEKVHNKRYYWTLGLKVNVSKWMLSSMYTYEKTGAGIDGESSHVHQGNAAVAYTLGSWQPALTFGMADIDDNHPSASMRGEQYQVALGCLYRINQNLKAWLIFRNITRQSKGGAIANLSGATENSAYSVLAGLAASF